MLTGQSRTGSCDHILDPILPNHKQIHLALYHNCSFSFANRILGFIKSIEQTRFLENRRLRRINILTYFSALRTGHNSAGKANRLSERVQERKHYAVSESIPISAALGFENQAGFFDVLDFIAKLQKFAIQSVG